jgi:cell division protein ZapA
MDSGGSEKKPVRVIIFNQAYTLRTSGDSRETEELARFVDSLMDGIASKTGDAEASRVAVLACLHLADRLRTLEGRFAKLKQSVDEKSDEFAVLLDQALGSPEQKT